MAAGVGADEYGGDRGAVKGKNAGAMRLAGAIMSGCVIPYPEPAAATAAPPAPVTGGLS
jgi:hypothetical protein